jgi:thioredoxin 1
MKLKEKWVRIALPAVIILAVGYFMFGSKVFSGKAGSMGSGAGMTKLAIPGKVTLIDLGATECLPCKMMAPIIEELKREYEGRADIVFIDVWKNPGEARKYGIRAIPTQIYYNKDGKEAFRNVGFMEKKRIVEVLTRLGAS